jgi:CBS domain-containing membrane protein
LRKHIRRNYRKARYIIYRETLINPADHLWTFAGSFIGIAAIALMHTVLDVSVQDKVFLIGSFGASSVLVYGIPNSPLAQPRNLIGGHLISAVTGVAMYKLAGSVEYYWLAPALAVSLAIVLMQVTKTLHPPGGATALIATIGSEKIKSAGFMYVISPVFSGVLILLVVAMAVNNIPANRRYPLRWRPVIKRFQRGS